ncbi:MAG: Mur ligase domain-containing protein, partial [Oscillospiraceae bacterium]|nr:Mur ligase domain-containing protein [Oscillospiraceae bacterium]
MKILTVRDAAEIMNGQYFGEKEGLNREITHAVIDSRAAAAGALFFCFAGEKADGHDFARDALSRGAAAAVAERPVEGGAYILVKSAAAALAALAKYRRDAFAKPVVAVVGSVGKTTAKEMTAAALGAKFSVLKTEKNLNNALGLPLTLSRLTDEYGAAVLELGVSDFGEMAPLAELARPDIVVFTRVAESHLEQFIDLDG